MTENSLNNDRFPTDLHLTLLAIAACAALSIALPAGQLQSFTSLVALILPYLPGRR